MKAVQVLSKYLDGTFSAPINRFPDLAQEGMMRAMAAVSLQLPWIGDMYGLSHIGLLVPQNLLLKGYRIF